ncbi:hypothetical protein [cyanobacterium endosymbiont of Rhopalodia gibberula]|uniref:hypothetical protein n=1 Tax=cyanobacterium endosymbiont of Rhopalodia gibberula TaxID=1763363 RepID=UPI001559266B|nr:hypothetical protein [cyanobacterium endosymbiont of Rhopalodia gibberula]
MTLKMLAFSPHMQREQFKLFEKKSQVLQTLNHPCIPRYRNYFEIAPEDDHDIFGFTLV